MDLQMESISTIVLGGIAAVVLAGFGCFGVVSLRENEKRAAGVSFSLAASGFLFLLALALPQPIKLGLVAILSLAIAALIIAALLPVGRVDPRADVPQPRYDERDIMFARAHLVPESPEYESYYTMRPQNRAADDLCRSKPGLLSPQAQEANPYLFASAHAGSDLTRVLRDCVDGPVAHQQSTLPPAEMTLFLKSLALYYGALRAGIAELHPYHVYSHVGRGSGRYGEPITLEHRYAIAFTVEMNHRMIAANPAAPGIVESVKQYVEAARVAVQLAGAIRRLGYHARAHIDANYRVIAPLVARDAGLGEIGRMGLLITLRHGPRVRIGVVTTSLELVPDPPTRDSTVIDFCNLCNKCAECCPTRSIPHGKRQEIDGNLRWRINADTCYRYWCIAGTDCGVCMTACPYSHPDNFSHNLVRWGIAHSGFLRRAAYRLDNMFYGRKPTSRTAPEWTKVH
jgi:ferredoxin